MKVHFSSENQKWATPQPFFNKLNERFKFTLDPAAEPETAKCEKYYTPKENGLIQSWQGEQVFCNPPYGSELPKWILKACLEQAKGNSEIVLLIPARTDTTYFHDLLWDTTNNIGQPFISIEFIRGRLQFGTADYWASIGQKPTSAPFPLMLAILWNLGFTNDEKLAKLKTHKHYNEIK